VSGACENRGRARAAVFGAQPTPEDTSKPDALLDFTVGPGYDKAYRAFQSVFCREATAQPREGCKIQGAVQDK
jgi:hypothetical protein